MARRLVPAGGGPVPLHYELLKAARAQAHRDAAVAAVTRAMAKIAEGEAAGVLRGTLASAVGPEMALQELADEPAPRQGRGTLPSTASESVAPSRGFRDGGAPVAVDQASTVVEDDLVKEALLGLGRRLASSMAKRRSITQPWKGEGSGIIGSVGKFLQKDVTSPIRGGAKRMGLRSPIKTTDLGSAGKVRSLQSPIKRRPKPAPAAPSPATPPPIPRDAYRTPGTPTAPATRGRSVGHVETPPPPTPVKRKGLVRSLLPGALMLGAGYGLYKGVPAATQALSRAANSPMAHSMGHQQYQYGYTPQGQAQF